MNLDAKVCYCFHVTQRKLLSFLRHEKPVVASLMSHCGGAGTGCGWCVPYLQKMHLQFREVGTANLEIPTEDYERGRETHIRDGKGKPPGS